MHQFFVFRRTEAVSEFLGILRLAFVPAAGTKIFLSEAHYSADNIEIHADAVSTQHTTSRGPEGPQPYNVYEVTRKNLYVH